MDIEEVETDDPNFNPWDVIPDKFALPILPQYTCSWTGPVMKENGDICKAGGFTPSITYQRALQSATKNLFHGIVTI